MDIYEVHTVHPQEGSRKEEDIREAVVRYLGDPRLSLRLNIDGVILKLNENMIAYFENVLGE